jgi:hypothetical protein
MSPCHVQALCATVQIFRAIPYLHQSPHQALVRNSALGTRNANHNL